MLEKLEKKEFDAFASTHPCNTFFQSSSWGELKEITGWDSHIVGIKEKKKIVAATLLLSKSIPVLNKKMFYAPRGFLLDYDNLDMVKNFTLEVKDYVKKNKGIFFKINPYVKYQERDTNGDIVGDKNNKELVSYLKKIGYTHQGLTLDYGKELEPRWISVLDLENKTEDEILKNMRSTTRLGIKNSYKHGLNLVKINESRLPEFKKLMEHTGERRGFIDRSLGYYKKMYESFSKEDNIKIMLVELDAKTYLENLKKEKDEVVKLIEPLKDATGAKGKRQLKEYQIKLDSLNPRIEELEEIKKEGDKVVVAGGLFMTFGTQVISLFGASYRKYMHFNGQYFLNMEMIKYALNNNYKKYNFLGITGHFEESNSMYGLFNFKRGFNADVVELIGEFTYVTDKLGYNLYKFMFGLYRKIKRMKVK